MPDKTNPLSIVIYSYPQFVFAWPLIVFGYILAAMQSSGIVGESSAAWTYIILLSLVMLTMGVDLGRNASIFCLVLLGGLWLGILWLQDAKNIMFFSKIADMISSLQPAISTHALVALSTILLIIYLIMFFLSSLNDRWRITHNEIEHHSFGHRDDATGRGAKRVLATYPDVLELLICLSGTIEVYSANGTQKLVSIKNVPFLPIRMKTISHILESSAVSDYNALSEEESEETPTT